MGENLIIYDWLSFTSKLHDPLLIVDVLGLSHVPWETIKGARGYQDRLYFNCISIHFNGRDDMGVWCEMSGQGCRAFETLSSLQDGWETLFETIAQQKMNITRLDVAYVSLSIPYEDFVSLEQIVLAAERNELYDNEHDTLTRTLVLGDEFSVQMNSRNFKTNIDPLFLNTILTCRHYYISLYYTAQRFGHVDALLRQVTSSVIECDKLWRFQRLNSYDAWDLENSTNTQLIAPIARGCWFVLNRDYNAYNTLACVGNLKKSMKAGDMMNEEEILKLQQNTQQSNMEGITNPSKRWMKSRKKQNK